MPVNSRPAAAEPQSEPVLRVLQAAAECAGAGIDLRQSSGEVLSLASAPACNRCRRVTPAIYVRCTGEVRPGLGAGQSDLCVHGQVLRVVAGGRLLAVAPAHRAARFADFLEGVTELATGAEMSGALERTVRSLVAAIEVKDPYTRGHSERVQIACELVGGLLELNRETRTDLGWAALLHDVGKIGSPDHILKKPGKLTREEYQVMKQHPLDGEDLLGPLTWLEGARRGVRHHHERFDGEGYPDRLKGKAIPVIARVIAVADSFDAMTSRRQYRGETGAAQALEVLKREAGTQFDSEIVTAFCDNFDRIHSVLLTAATPAEGLFASPDVAADDLAASGDVERAA